MLKTSAWVLGAPCLRLLTTRCISTKADHYDLDSFLRHSKNSNLSPTSTYYKGTLFEYQVQAVLRACNICLHRVGGTDDRGIDLRGRWVLPPHTNYAEGIPVVAQCKAEQRPMGPKYLRELEGATAGEEPGTIVLMATTGRTTLGARRVISACKRPMGIVVVIPLGDDSELRIRQFMWNEAAQQILGPELSAKTITHVESEEAPLQYATLTWNDRTIKPRIYIDGFKE
jgi:Required for respiratory growth protein 7